MEHFNSETRKDCQRYLRRIKKELRAQEKTLSERDPAEDWMKQLIDDIAWLISALPKNAKSFEIVDSISDFKFKCAAYRFTEIVERDEARFKIRRCYPSSDFSVQEYVILIDTTPDRDRGVFYALSAFGDDDSEDF